MTGKVLNFYTVLILLWSLKKPKKSTIDIWKRKKTWKKTLVTRFIQGILLKLISRKKGKLRKTNMQIFKKQHLFLNHFEKRLEKKKISENEETVSVANVKFKIGQIFVVSFFSWNFFISAGNTVKRWFSNFLLFKSKKKRLNILKCYICDFWWRKIENLVTSRTLTSLLRPSAAN